MITINLIIMHKYVYIFTITAFLEIIYRPVFTGYDMGYLYRLDPNEKFPPEDEDEIQSSKSCVF
jgi:hypothetical protein